MKTLSIEKMEGVEGGCIEYALAWAEATYSFMGATTDGGSAYYSAKAVYYLNSWMNCTYQ